MSQTFTSLTSPERKALAEHAIEKSREALQHGERRTARRYAEQAASLVPEREDPWLLLAALASPHASIAYLEHALEINPASQRASKGLDWARKRLKDQELDKANKQIGLSSQPIYQPQDTPSHRTIVHIRAASRRRHPAIPLFFVYAFGTLFLSVVFFTASLIPYYPNIIADTLTSLQMEAPILSKVSDYLTLVGPEFTQMPTPTIQSSQIGQAPDIAQETTPPLEIDPSETLISPSPTFTVLVPESPTPPPTQTPVPTDTPLPTATPTDIPTPSPQPTLSPPTPTTAPLPTKKPKKKVAASNGPGFRPGNVTLNDHWIDVDLSTQTTYAMQGDQVVRSFVVSTGRWPTVTITGVYKIYVKYRSANMSGDDYFLPNVPYVMYFFKGYGLHGTYWHNNFGTPMSHGCVNLRTDDASWLFTFASVGTVVNVHQ